MHTLKPDDIFSATIGPFQGLWQKLRISGAAVLRNGQWISMSTRVALSCSEVEPEFFINPTNDFMAFSCDRIFSGFGLSELTDLLKDVNTKGNFKVQLAGIDFNIFLTLDHSNSAPNLPPFQFLFISTPSDHSTRSFELGAIEHRLESSTVESQMKLMNYPELRQLSSTLRVYTPAFGDVSGLLRFLRAPFNSNQNHSSFQIAAPLPFSMICSDTAITVKTPRSVAQKIQVIGFFDTGQSTAQLGSLRTDDDGFAIISGPIPWPEKSRSGKLFLYFNNHEVGSVCVRRWSGTTNWRIRVQEFFDPQYIVLKRALEARKEQTEFEQAVVRLLNELRISTIWYGSKQYHDRPDLAACVETKERWIVLLGECTVQKPSDKFTLLLTRKKELEKLLQEEVQILPAVFTSSVLSTADKEQARQDGIALVGADELTTMLQGVGQDWNAEQLLWYLSGLARTHKT